MRKAFDKTNISKLHERFNRHEDKIKPSPANRGNEIYEGLFPDIYEKD